MASIKLKVSDAEYAQRISAFDSKISEMEQILAEYEALKNSATTKVFGESDSNTEALKQNVQENISRVKQMQNDLRLQRDELQKQQDELGLTTNKIGELIRQAGETASAVFNTVHNLDIG